MNTDVVVIGTGQAGVPLATALCKQGKNVVVVERAAPGGTCVNSGCTPTKTMIASAQAAHIARTSATLGVRTAGVDVDFAAVVDRKDAMVARWRSGIERRLSRAGERLTLIRGRAQFTGDRTIEVNGQRISGEMVVINTGARARTPAIEGLGLVPWRDYAGLLELRQLPRHLIVVGSGYVGCEFAQMFRRFGAAVTVVGRAAHLLPREDDELGQALEDAFTAEGIELRLAARIEHVARADSDVTVALTGGELLRGSHLLIATGRQPNTDDLGCQAAGVKLDEDGHIIVDDDYRTSATGVFAVGDVIPGPQFTHVSWDDHRRLLAVLAGQARGGRSGAQTPYTVFTDPPVAGVGLSERQARQGGIDYEVATMPFGNIARAIETDQRAGLLKVLIDPLSERILGARVMGSAAGELIHVYAALMAARAPARVLVDTQMVHPTFAEGLQSVLLKLPRYASP
jgi:pyruvate/2-oxoglutarate dehydrogenase complex dihydrolipoamide dehydrogenase (E3) component